MDRERYPTGLFTRRRIAELTGVDASTLNLWVREGVLRPAEGGLGRGSHRRFPYWEVTLAALLLELRGFGIGTNALAGLAGRFHDAIDWAKANGVTRTNFSRLFSAYLIRWRIVCEGRYTWEVRSEEDRSYFAGFELHEDERGIRWVEMDWEQAVTHWFRPRLDPREEFKLVPEEIALVGSWNTVEELRAFSRRSDLFNAITTINFRDPAELRSDPDQFVRDDDGMLTLAREWQGPPPTSYIGVDLGVLTHRVWVERAGC